MESEGLHLSGTNDGTEHFRGRKAQNLDLIPRRNSEGLSRLYQKTAVPGAQMKPYSGCDVEHRTPQLHHLVEIAFGAEELGCFHRIRRHSLAAFGERDEVAQGGNAQVSFLHLPVLVEGGSGGACDAYPGSDERPRRRRMWPI